MALIIRLNKVHYFQNIGFQRFHMNVYGIFNIPNFTFDQYLRLKNVVFQRLLQGVNFINILHGHFSYVSLFGSISLVTFGFVIFGTKILYEKRGSKTLMKLTPGYRRSKRRESELRQGSFDGMVPPRQVPQQILLAGQGGASKILKAKKLVRLRKHEMKF